MKQTLTEEGLNHGNVIRRDFRSCLTEAEREAAFVENCSWKLSSSVESTYTPETQIHGWLGEGQRGLEELSEPRGSRAVADGHSPLTLMALCRFWLASKEAGDMVLLPILLSPLWPPGPSYFLQILRISSSILLAEHTGRAP